MGEEWTVLDKAPGPDPLDETAVRASLQWGHGGLGSSRLPYAPSWFWLHRRDEHGAYHSKAGHARDLELVEDPYAECRGRRKRATA
jgi:hypothetical protein